MTGPIEDRRRGGRLMLLAIFCACFIVGATVTSIVSSMQRADDLAAEEARDRARSCENRLAIIEAFEFYTDALVASSSPPPDAPPDELEARTARIEAFRAEVDRRLEPLKCTPTKENQP